MDVRYELHEEIGRGAGGVIFRATDHDLGRQVALKRLDREGSTRLQRLRFVTEAQVPAQLEHPNIIPVHDIGKTAQGDLYYVMKLVRGRTLKQAMTDGAARAVLLDALAEVCQGLAFAHHQDVLHRDIKPSNLMLGAFGEVLILDWGLARAPQGTVRDQVGPMTLDGDVLGSLGYMAAEQARGHVDAQGPWTDVHAVGGILYEILVGTPPRHARSLPELLPKLDALPSPPPGPLGALALRCLASNPQARPRNAQELGELLELARS
ncbi:MAG: serine/threonine-protein kinase [Myxococcota bacterium]|nr:serine/threonine-protein kinase [Myxococcota bacterium]